LTNCRILGVNNNVLTLNKIFVKKQGGLGHPPIPLAFFLSFSGGGQQIIANQHRLSIWMC
ncbi:MAG TPA: hypothetical protein DCS88_03575, partial [Alphaproteobacteria bacterium]|nr:hypothetical protein [Alphaproteobacteria bacterium]